MKDHAAKSMASWLVFEGQGNGELIMPPLIPAPSFGPAQFLRAKCCLIPPPDWLVPRLPFSVLNFLLTLRWIAGQTGRPWSWTSWLLRSHDWHMRSNGSEHPKGSQSANLDVRVLTSTTLLLSGKPHGAAPGPLELTSSPWPFHQDGQTEAMAWQE